MCEQSDRLAAAFFTEIQSVFPDKSRSGEESVKFFRDHIIIHHAFVVAEIMMSVAFALLIRLEKAGDICTTPFCVRDGIDFMPDESTYSTRHMRSGG